METFKSVCTVLVLIVFVCSISGYVASRLFRYEGDDDAN